MSGADRGAITMTFRIRRSSRTPMTRDEVENIERTATEAVATALRELRPPVPDAIRRAFDEHDHGS